ncbi:MAG: hypothetical protein WC467_01360 [Patescibacteria group bacterium]
MEDEKTIINPELNRTGSKLTPVFDMVEDACGEYWQNIRKFIEVYVRGLLGMLPFFFLGLLYRYLSETTYFLDGLFVRLLSLVILLLAGLAAIYFGVRTRAAMILLIKSKYASAKENFVLSKNYFWSFLGVSLLGALIIALWSILLIIPGIVFAIFYLLFNYTFFFEELKGFKALRRSRELVKGYWWAVFGRVLFVGLIAGVFDFILSSPLGLMVEGSAGFVIYNSIINIIWALLAPIIVIYIYYIYRDLRALKK